MVWCKIEGLLGNILTVERVVGVVERERRWVWRSLEITTPPNDIERTDSSSGIYTNESSKSSVDSQLSRLMDFNRRSN